MRTNTRSVTARKDQLTRETRLLARSTLGDLKVQYAGTSLGLVWLIAGPLILVGLYSAIYLAIFQVRIEGLTSASYILGVLAGLVPFMAFAQTLGSTVNSLRKGEKNLFSGYPAHLIPIRATLVAYAGVPIGFGVLIAADFLINGPNLWVLGLLPVLLLQVLFSAGIGFILALTALVLRDVIVLVQYATIFFLIVTPIAYVPSMIPPELRLLFQLNPLYYFTISYQSLTVLDTFPPVRILLVAAALGIGSFFVGLYIFNRAREAIFDLI